MHVDIIDRARLAEEIKVAQAAHKPGAGWGGTLATITHAIVEHVARNTARRIAELEARIAVLEQQKSVRYRGTWHEIDADYQPGEMATHGGTVWYCSATTHDRPGTSKAWQLMVKSR